jgi:hypothetical protein
MKPPAMRDYGAINRRLFLEPAWRRSCSNAGAALMRHLRRQARTYFEILLAALALGCITGLVSAIRDANFRAAAAELQAAKYALGAPIERVYVLRVTAPVADRSSLLAAVFADAQRAASLAEGASLIRASFASAR